MSSELALKLYANVLEWAQMEREGVRMAKWNHRMAIERFCCLPVSVRASVVTLRGPRAY